MKILSLWICFFISIRSSFVEALNSSTTASSFLTLKAKVTKKISSFNTSQLVERENDQISGSDKKDLGLLFESEECGNDILRFCSDKKTNQSDNFLILSCLVNSQNNSGISIACNQHLWQFKLNITNDIKYDGIAKNVCRHALLIFPECDRKPLVRELISCLSEKLVEIKEEECLSFLIQYQSIVYSDYRLIGKFATQCEDDIVKFQCLENESREGEPRHIQGQVLSCIENVLVNNPSALHPQCFDEVVRIVNVSAQDYHFDRAVYFNCEYLRRDCISGWIGRGKFYQCLYQYYDSSWYRTGCTASLLNRKVIQSIGRRFQANLDLLQECQLDIVKHKCDSSALDPHRIHLTSAMICLQRIKHPAVLSTKCKHKIGQHRQMLMENYEISPDIVRYCFDNVKKGCYSEKMVEGTVTRSEFKQSEMIHCLLNQNRDRVSNHLDEGCSDALSQLVKESGVVDDYRIDSVLVDACKSMINSKCLSNDSDVTIVPACLMDNIDDANMTESCQNAVLDLQYHVSRDLSLDPTFREACYDDVQLHCDALQGLNGSSIDVGTVISCLYPHVQRFNIQADALSSQCSSKVFQIVRQRALNFSLNPDVEGNCTWFHVREGDAPSTTTCYYNYVYASKFECLQNERFRSDLACRTLVKDLTSLEYRHILDFDAIPMKECGSFLRKYCQDEVDGVVERTVVQCFTTYKERIENQTCADSITRFQQIGMKNYRLNDLFMAACGADVARHQCDEWIDGPNMFAVIACLSRADQGVASTEDLSTTGLTSQCRMQLQVEKQTMHTNIKFNSKLDRRCKCGVQQLCAAVKPGRARVLECLRKHKLEMSFLYWCRDVFFSFEKEEAEDPSLDYQLMHECEGDIGRYCADIQKTQIVSCLMRNKYRLISTCEEVVLVRERNMFSDIELNVDVRTSCSVDIDRYCKNERDAAAKSRSSYGDVNGIVYSCLFEVFVKDSVYKSLTAACYSRLEFVISEQQRDYDLNPSLTEACSYVINSLCPKYTNSDAVECLKKKFAAEKILDNSCALEVGKALQQGRSSIVADPVLRETCKTDIATHCHNVASGHGRVIQCLIRAQYSLSQDCAHMLNERQAMWNMVLKRFGGSFSAIVHSGYFNYILILVISFILSLCIISIHQQLVKKRRKAVLSYVNGTLK